MASEHGPDWTEEKTEAVFQLSVVLSLSIFTGTKAACIDHGLLLGQEDHSGEWFLHIHCILRLK